MRLALALFVAGIATSAVAGCSAISSTSNAALGEQVPVAAQSQSDRAYAVPDKLAIARERVAALVEEQRVATTEQVKVTELIATLKEAKTCKKDPKPCDKKLALLVDERSRLNSRVDQLPAAIAAAQARLGQLEASNA